MFLAWNVYQRHRLIGPVLAVFEEETKALELLTWLSWVMPLMVYCTSFLDPLLMVVYQKWLHPWKRILAKVLPLSSITFLVNRLSHRITSRRLLRLRSLGENLRSKRPWLIKR